jgi:hypothetical protein
VVGGDVTWVASGNESQAGAACEAAEPVTEFEFAVARAAPDPRDRHRIEVAMKG